MWLFCGCIEIGLQLNACFGSGSRVLRATPAACTIGGVAERTNEIVAFHEAGHAVAAHSKAHLYWVTVASGTASDGRLYRGRTRWRAGTMALPGIRCTTEPFESLHVSAHCLAPRRRGETESEKCPDDHFRSGTRKNAAELGSLRFCRGR